MKLFVKFILIVGCYFESHALDKISKKNKIRIERSLSSTHDEQEKIVVGYFKCFENFKGEQELKICINNFLSSKLSTSQRDRFYSWLLVFDAKLSAFNKCGTRKLKEAAAFPEATLIYICGTLDLGEIKKEAVFFFKKENGVDKLWSVHY